MRFLVLLLLLSAASASAQPRFGPSGAVLARVVDAETGETLPSATLALYAAADSAFVTGAAAGADGRVSVSVDPGAYVARFSFVGFSSRTVPVNVSAGATDLGDVALAADATQLGEAEVTARRSFVEQEADRTVYNVQEQAVTTGGSVLETLQTLPSLDVDTDGNVSLRGNQNVVVQINGRPTPVRGAFLAALLRQIPADRVERVEVIPNPSARYEPDGMSGIVNIVLKEGTDRGLSGGVTAGGGTELSSQVGANLSYQRGPWDANVQYGFRYTERDTDITTAQQAVSGAFLLDQASETDRNEDSHFANGSLVYDLAPGTSLALEGSLGLRDDLSGGLSEFSRTVGGTTALSDIASETEGDGFNGDLALVFRRQFGRGGGGAEDGGPPGMGRPGGMRGRMMGGGGPRGGAGTQSDHELAVEARYTHNDDDGRALFADSQGGALSGYRYQLTDEATDVASLQLDYTRPLGSVRLELGGRVSDERIASDRRFETGPALGALEVDPNQTNAFDYNRQIGAVYAQFAAPLGPFQAQAGLRAEAARRSFDLATPVLPPYDEGLSSESTDQDYTSLFPSAFLTYAYGPGSIAKASYSRRIERPRTGFLNPFPDLSDTTFVRIGTPDLRPAYTDAIELTLQYKFFATLTPFYRRTTDVIARRVFTDPDTGVSLFRPGNLDTETNMGADLTFFGQFGGVRGFVSGSVFQSNTTDPDPGEEDTEALAWSLRANAQLALREGTDLQGFALYRAPQETVDGRRGAFVFSSIGVNQKVSEALRLSARLNDPFGLARFEFETDDGVFLRDTEFDPNIRAASLTLTYTFGSSPQRARPQAPAGGLDDGGFGI